MMKSILVYTIITLVVLFLLSRSSTNNNPQPFQHTDTDDEFNVTNRIARLFPEIDVDPTDQFVSVHELSQWNVHHVQRLILHRSQKEMVVYDKNHDGFVSFSEFGLSTSTSGSLSSFIFFILHFLFIYLEIIILV
jgi:Ca2+-binding EF-hand superfamily protein